MKTQLFSGIVLLMASTLAQAQQHFSTPDQASDALTAAIGEHNESAMSSLLGERWRDFLPAEGVDPEAVDRFLRDWKVQHNTVISGDVALCMQAQMKEVQSSVQKVQPNLSQISTQKISNQCQS